MDAFTPSPATGRVRRPRCRGTVEDHQKVALDVRELTRHGVFDAPVGTVWRHCAFRWPWLRTMRLNTWSLVLQLATGRTETVPWTLVPWGAIGNRPLFLCPHCRQRVRWLYHLVGEIVCQSCGKLCMRPNDVAPTAAAPARHAPQTMSGFGAARNGRHRSWPAGHR